ncbi:ANTAR domain-containing protein [Lentzea sp. HUAS12]|uniref:ANTAR domain-containing protein n=1 Tax=Lentzea sp. HUAS12 TaxID=2951806 RepID=UPI0020A188CF|nr:ANTAR domain-containing protein [Lentzea sp. HUAS12]USX55628.1 ANTAR domain-containing protein [Lentzea sp. HUAS12]
MPTKDPSIEPGRDVEQLREALDRQPVIEQAKGVLMVLQNWSADEAFEALVGLSQCTNTKLHVVATILVASASREQPMLPGAEVVDAVLAEVRRIAPGHAFDRTLTTAESAT